MEREQITKIAYKTLQQGKSIAGLAHKEISSRLMNLILLIVIKIISILIKIY